MRDPPIRSSRASRRGSHETPDNDRRRCRLERGLDAKPATIDRQSYVQSPEPHRFPPHRRQGRLVAAGRRRRRRVQRGLACRRLPTTSRGCTATSATCWSCPRARSRSAARCSSCRRARSSSRTARPPPRSDRSRSRAPGRRRSRRHGITAGQVLVTLQDTEERRRYLNARSTIERLLEWRAVPVINENDTVATNEIRYGDNDRLAARVATMASADLLVLLSDIDGLYDAPPGATRRRQAHSGGRAHHAARSRRWRAPPAPSFRAAACRPRSKPARSRRSAGTHMVIASGRIRASA